MAKNIKVKKIDFTGIRYVTGGGYAVTDLEINIDKSLSEEDQVCCLFHEFIEAHLGLIMNHDKINELEEEFRDAYEQWRNG
jgi:hypothetical protein